MVIIPLLLAASISSSKINTFMRTPDWIPDAVDNESTFGSEGRTNVSKRTTLNTIAAVESVFDAWHERVFYASEGRTNDWNIAEYGPRPNDLQRIWVTNAVPSSPFPVPSSPFPVPSSQFIYGSWSTNWPRATPESRRLLEFDNLFALSYDLPRLFSRPRKPFIDKGDTWGRERDVMFASSWGPVGTDLLQIDWTENASFSPNIATNCVPLCYCRPDKAFNRGNGEQGTGNGEQGTGNGFLWDVLKDLDADFNALWRIEEVDYYRPNIWTTNGFLYAWHRDKRWTNSHAAQSTVPGIITNEFPLAGPELAMTNLTRRLLPDDSFRYEVKTNGFRVIETRTQSKTARELFSSVPSGVRSTRPVTWVYYFAELNGVALDRYVTPQAGTTDAYKRDYGLSTIFAVSNFDFGAPPSGTQFTEGEIEATDLWYDFTTPYGDRYSGEMRGESYETPIVAKLTYYAYNIETTKVEFASSLLATESRALAMLDRTYEVPKRVAVTNIAETAGERDTERRMRSSLRATGETTRTVQLGLYDYTPFDETVYLSDILGTPEIEYSTTNIYTAIKHPDVVERRLTGGGIGASGGFTVFDAGIIGTTFYTVADLKRFLAAHDGVSGQWYEVISVTAFDEWYSGNATVTVTFTGRDGQYTFRDDSFSVDLYSLVPTGPVDLRIGGDLEITRSANVFIGGIPGQASVSRMFPWYGPGPYGFLHGAVKSSRVLFAEEVLAFFVDYPSGSATEWKADDPVRLPVPVPVDQGRDWEWNSWHRLAASQPSGGVGSGLASRVYDETAGALAAKVEAEFSAKVGNYSNAQAVIPVSIDCADLEYQYAYGASVNFNPCHAETNFVWTTSGPSPSDVRIRLPNEQQDLPDGYPVVAIKPYITVHEPGYPIDPNYEKMKLPVAVDGRLRPVIVTDWNWKALNSTKGQNQ